MIVFLVRFLCDSSSRVPAFAGEVNDSKAARALLKQQWESLETLRFVCEETTVDEAGDTLPSPRQRVEFASASGGRRAVRTAGVSREGKAFELDIRQDGRRKYVVTRVPGHPDLVDEVRIINQTESPDRAETLACIPHWLLSPKGRPLYTWFDGSDVVFGNPRGDGKSSFPSLESTFDQYSVIIRIELDPAHDWQARRIVLLDKGKPADPALDEMTVTRFARSGGRWFPAEGTATKRRSNHAWHQRFVVDELDVNGSLDPSSFGLPPENRGMVIVDEVNKKSRVIGGVSARKYIQSLTPQDVSSTDVPIVADRNPPGSVLRPVLVTSSLGVLVIAIVIARVAKRS